MAEQSNALMVVVGAGRSDPVAALVRIFEGSVAHDLVSHQRHQPVLVVPAGNPEDASP